MRKSEINKIIRNNSPFQSGKITAVNADGSYNVRIKGRANSIKNIPNAMGTKFKLNDFVSIGQVMGDSQKPAIIGYGSYFASGTLEIIDI